MTTAVTLKLIRDELLTLFDEAGARPTKRRRDILVQMLAEQGFNPQVESLVEFLDKDVSNPLYTLINLED